MADPGLNTLKEESEEELANISIGSLNDDQDDEYSERENRNWPVNLQEERPEKATFTEVNISMETLNRECFVCFDSIRNNQKSIQPCPCGYWVHQHCLVTGIQSYEAHHPGCAPLGCRFCVKPYNISPKKDLAYKMLDKVSVKYARFCEFGYRAIAVVFVDSTFTIVGFALLNKIYGHKEAGEMLFSMNPIKAVAICKSVPLISITINYIPWEAKLLRFLRRCSNLPVVGSVFPFADPRVRETKYRRTLFGVLVGGLLLPWHASMFGVLFGRVVPSRLHRFLLGGLAFIALKGLLQMYYRQKIYVRQFFLSVEPYRGD